MIDTAKLRALVAAAFDGVLPLRAVGQLHAVGNNWGIEDVNGFDVAGDMYQADAEAIVAAVNGAGPLLDELEALRAAEPVAVSWARSVSEAEIRAAERSHQRRVIAEKASEDWALASECESPAALADTLRRMDAQLTAWRTATGCDTPEEAARVVSVFDEATHLARGQREELIAANRDLGRLAMRQQAELDRLRELRDALLAWCESSRHAHVRDTREEQRLDRAIAAEHAAAKEGK